MEEMNYVVNGFRFYTREECAQAQKESETIEYLKSNTDLTHIKTVAKLYSNLIKKDSFHTIIGYSFLCELKEIIIKANVVPVEKIPVIPIKSKFQQKESTVEILKKEQEQGKLNKLHMKVEEYQMKYKRMVLIVGGLICIIAAMIILVLNSDYSPFLDVEKRVLDNYAYWQEELQEKEKMLQEREELIQQKEEELKILN